MLWVVLYASCSTSVYNKPNTHSHRNYSEGDHDSGVDQRPSSGRQYVTNSHGILASNDDPTSSTANRKPIANIDIPDYYGPDHDATLPAIHTGPLNTFRLRSSRKPAVRRRSPYGKNQSNRHSDDRWSGKPYHLLILIDF